MPVPPLHQQSYDEDYGGGMRIPDLTTQRLVLRALGERHLDEWTRLQTDPRIAEWLGGVPDPQPDPQTAREDAWRVMAMFAGHWALRGYGQWAMEHADTGRLIGRAGLWNPEGWPGVEVGWMVDSAEWGRGYASEAGRMAVDWAFTTLDLDEVISVTLPHNTASRRVMEKVGLTDTGTTVTLRGHEQVLYRITRTDWERTTRTDWESNASTS